MIVSEEDAPRQSNESASAWGDLCSNVHRGSQEDPKATQHPQKLRRGIQKLPWLTSDTNDHGDGTASVNVDVFRPKSCHVHASGHGVQDHGQLLHCQHRKLIVFRLLTSSCELFKPRAAKKTPARALGLD